jgi:uncharacterized protein YjiS (DUF1127 family)
MTTYLARHAAANLLSHAGDTMRAGADALHALAKRLDDWLAARAKSIDDHNALGAMSERELRDIGIDPARVHGQPWLRDWAA